MHVSSMQGLVAASPVDLCRVHLSIVTESFIHSHTHQPKTMKVEEVFEGNDALSQASFVVYYSPDKEGGIRMPNLENPFDLLLYKEANMSYTGHVSYSLPAFQGFIRE